MWHYFAILGFTNLPLGSQIYIVSDDGEGMALAYACCLRWLDWPGPGMERDW